MTGLLLNVIALSVSVSVLVLILFVLSRLFGKKVTAKCRYVIWAIVIVRLCLPIGLAPEKSLISFEIPSSVQTVTESPVSKPEVPDTETVGRKPINDTPAVSPITDAPAVNPSVDTPAMKPTADTPATKPIADDTPSVSDTPAVNPTVDTPAAKPSVDAPADDADASFVLPPVQTVLAIASYIWLGGAVLFGGIRLAVHFAETSSYKRRRRLCDDGIYSVYSAVCDNMGISDRPKLYFCDSVESPLLYGVIRPCIMLPEYSFTDAQLSSVLSHELTHFRRRDLIMKFVCLFAEAVHWFNPVVHIASKRCSAEMELSCDEAVLLGQNEDVRNDYGNTVLDVIRNCKAGNRGITTHFNPQKNAVKERIMNILDTTKKRRGRAVIAVALVLATLSGLLIGCANSPDDRPKPSGEDTHEVTPGGNPEDKTEAIRLQILSRLATEDGIVLEDVSFDPDTRILTAKWKNTYADTASVSGAYCVSHITRDENGTFKDDVLPEPKVKKEPLSIMASGTAELTYDLSPFTFADGEVYRVYFESVEPGNYSVDLKYVAVTDTEKIESIASPEVSVNDGMSAFVSELDMNAGSEKMTVCLKNKTEKNIPFDQTYFVCRFDGTTFENTAGSFAASDLRGINYLQSGATSAFTYDLSAIDFAEGEIYRVYLNNGESGDCHVDFRYESAKVYSHDYGFDPHGTDTVSVSVDDFNMQYGAEQFTVEWKNNGTDDFVQNFDFAVYHKVGDKYERMEDNDILVFTDGANILSPENFTQTKITYDLSEIEFADGEQYRVYLNGKAETDFWVDFTYKRDPSPEPEDEWVKANRTIPATLPKYHQGDTVVWSHQTAFNVLGLLFTPDYRTVFYNGYEQLRSLVPAAEYDTWCKETVRDDVEWNEMYAVSFIKHFRITREQFDSVITEAANGATEKEETLNGDILYTFDNSIIDTYYSRRVARDLTSVPTKGEVVTTLDGLAKLGLPEGDLRPDYIRAFVTADVDSLMELYYVRGGQYSRISDVSDKDKAMFDPYRTLKISEWRAWTEDNDGYKKVYFEFYPTYSDIEKFKVNRWNTGYELVSGFCPVYLAGSEDKNVPGEASAEVARMFGHFFRYDMPKTLSGTQYNPYSLIIYICQTLPVEDQTEEKVNAYAKKYFGIDDFIPEGKRIEDYYFAHGGSTVFMNTVAAEDLPDGSVKVTVQYYADWSKTVKSHTVNYTVKKIDGYFAITGYEEVYISEYEPVSFSV